MGSATSKCEICDALCWDINISERGWCHFCEGEFTRLQNQREARRVLQRALDLGFEFEIKKNG